VRNDAEITERIAAFAPDPNGALVVLPSSLAIEHRRSIIGVSAMHRLPAVYPFRLFTVDGGLMSYGIRSLDLYIGAASYIDRILRGAKVAELPVQLPTKYELVINLKAATIASLKIPPTLVVQADEVIE
jgi:putative ABC transport system substrate-binding protein